MTTTITWICKECEGGPSFNNNDFVKHAREIHGIEPGTRYNKTGVVFLDGQGWARRVYECVFPGMRCDKIEEDTWHGH